jgi:hypothetical protein
VVYPVDPAVGDLFAARVARTRRLTSVWVPTKYGMPACAKDGQVVCSYQPAAKFKARYATLGFDDPAGLDEGAMWPTAFPLTRLTAADEKRIGALVEKAAGRGGARMGVQAIASAGRTSRGESRRGRR